MLNRNSSDGERLSALNQSLNALATEHMAASRCRELLMEAASVKELLNSLCETVHQKFPIITHRYSLANQILIGAEKAQTDCRFSATLLGKLMMETNIFDMVALCHQFSSDLHIGVLGVHEGTCYHAHFFEPYPGYEVSEFTAEKVAENTLFPVNAKGIVRLDKHLMST